MSIFKLAPFKKKIEPCTVMAFYEDGKMTFKNSRFAWPSTYQFDDYYDAESRDYFIPEGWYEYHEPHIRIEEVE